MKRTKKHMLIGLMLCGALAFAGGVAALNAYDGESVAVRASAEESTFSEVATKASVVNYANGRLKIVLSGSDYANAPNNDPSLYMSHLSALNTFTNITVNGVALGEISSASEVVYLQMWEQQGFWVNILEPKAGDIVVIPAGTQFPSADYAYNGGNTVYVTSSAVAYKFDGSTWVSDYSSVEFTEIETDVTIHRWDPDSQRLMLKVAGGDHANANSNTSLSAGFYKALGTFDGILLNGTPISSMDLTDCHVKLYGEGDLTIGKLNFNARDIVTIKAGTKFPSYAFINEGTTTCYTTKEDMSWMFKPTEVSYQTFNWVRCDFEETDTEASVFTYANGRLGFRLSENDMPPSNDAETGDAIGENCNLSVGKDKIYALNLWDKITINGEKLNAVAGTDCYFNMWANPNSFFVPMAEPAEGAVVIIPEGTQFPSYSYVNGGAATCYTTTEDVKYVLEGGVWKKAVNVTINGETQEMLCGNKITKPETPADYEENNYKYTVVWYVAGTDTVYDFDAPLEADVAIESKYSSEAIEYTLDFAHPRMGPLMDLSTTFTVETIGDVVFPAIPEGYLMEGYNVAWNMTEEDLALENTTVTMTFEAIEYTVTFVNRAGMALEGYDPITFTVETIGEVVFPELPAQEEGWEAAWAITPADLALEDTQVTLIVFMTEYTITFMADGEVVDTATYYVEDKDNIVEPAVPEKEGYTGAWEAYELTTGDIIVNAVYTEIPVEPEVPGESEEPEVPGESEEPEVPGESEEPEVPGDSEEPEVPGDSEEPVDPSEPEEEDKKKKKGCGSSLGLGMAGALTAVGAALVIKKRKED